MVYTEEVMKRFRKPRHTGRIKNPDGVGEHGNLRCGDVMKFYIKVKGGKIVDAKFETFGCAAAIASSDALCELVRGKTIEQALKIRKEDILKPLGKLPPPKIHCSVLGIETLKDAIEDYKKRKKRKD